MKNIRTSIAGFSPSPINLFETLDSFSNFYELTAKLEPTENNIAHIKKSLDKLSLALVFKPNTLQMSPQSRDLLSLLKLVYLVL